jgi:hypothetical protein
MATWHFHGEHDDPFWSTTIYETFWIAALAAAVMAALIMGLSALAH